MGRYQLTVLILSGLGWAADNMWIQAIAIILPHIQRSFALTDGTVGLASSSIFVGMFVGSIAWGTISDSYGRPSGVQHHLGDHGDLWQSVGPSRILPIALPAFGSQWEQVLVEACRRILQIGGESAREEA